MCGLMSDLIICKFRKSMVIHDTECPYWDQVSSYSPMNQSALLPYVNGIILAQNNNDARIMYEPKVVKEKSKFYYKNFINSKLLSVDITSHFLQPYCIRNQIDEKELFVRRVCYEQDKKLKEFNFKMLYGILPCGVNLKKWKIRQTSLCDLWRVYVIRQSHIYYSNVSICTRIVEMCEWSSGNGYC